MALTLAVCSEGSGELPEISFDLPRVSIGRAESCDLRLPDLSISQHHASIRQRGHDYIILDEGSTNGTFVGPVRLAPQAPRVLQSGDRVRVGRLWLQVRFEPYASTSNQQLATKDLALQLVAQHLHEQGQTAIPELTVTAGDNQGAKLILTNLDHRYVLGRSATADLIITDTNASRRHVEVWRKGAQVFLRDLGSKNGSALDGYLVFPDKDLVWLNGAQLLSQDVARLAAQDSDKIDLPLAAGDNKLLLKVFNRSGKARLLAVCALEQDHEEPVAIKIRAVRSDRLEDSTQPAQLILLRREQTPGQRPEAAPRKTGQLTEQSGSPFPSNLRMNNLAHLGSPGGP